MDYRDKHPSIERGSRFNRRNRAKWVRIQPALTFCDAYGLLDLREYDLVLSDGRLPDGTGITLADKAKTKGIPTVIVTGYLPWLCDRNPKLDIRAYRVLEKPVRPSVLLAEVKNAIGG